MAGIFDLGRGCAGRQQLKQDDIPARRPRDSVVPEGKGKGLYFIMYPELSLNTDIISF